MYFDYVHSPKHLLFLSFIHTHQIWLLSFLWIPCWYLPTTKDGLPIIVVKTFTVTRIHNDTQKTRKMLALAGTTVDGWKYCYKEKMRWISWRLFKTVVTWKSACSYDGKNIGPRNTRMFLFDRFEQHTSVTQLGRSRIRKLLFYEIAQNVKQSLLYPI